MEETNSELRPSCDKCEMRKILLCKFTCCTITTHPPFNTGSTRSVRVSTLAMFAVMWTYTRTVCAKESFTTSLKLESTIRTNLQGQQNPFQFTIAFDFTSWGHQKQSWIGLLFKDKPITVKDNV